MLEEFFDSGLHRSDLVFFICLVQRIYAFAASLAAGLALMI
jgi:hypothetical protein